MSGADRPRRVCVTGGRDFAADAAAWDCLDSLHFRRPITLLGHGAARGADRIAGAWARRCGVPERPYPVDSALDGPWPAAGHRRNWRMLVDLDPELLVAFPGGAGTASCMEMAKRRGIPVMLACRGGG